MIKIFVLVAALCISLAVAHRAPDEAPDLPSGWCSHPGKPTKTTGECICVNSSCKGPKCRNESGFIYFSGVECPTCQCVPKDRTNNNQQVKYESPAVHAAPAEEKEDEEVPYSWAEYIYDNYDFVFGIIAAALVFVMGTVFLLQILGLVVVDNNAAAGTKPTSKAGPIEPPSEGAKDKKAD